MHYVDRLFKLYLRRFNKSLFRIKKLLLYGNYFVHIGHFRFSVYILSPQNYETFYGYFSIESKDSHMCQSETRSLCWNTNFTSQCRVTMGEVVCTNILIFPLKRLRFEHLLVQLWLGVKILKWSNIRDYCVLKPFP